MNDWGSTVGGAAAIVAACLAVVSANWTIKNRHAATKDALDIRDRLEGAQREAWDSVVQRHLDAELRRVAGPSPFAVGCVLFLVGYVLNLVSLTLSKSSLKGTVSDLMLPLIGLLLTVLGGLVFAATTWRSLRRWLPGSHSRSSVGREASPAAPSEGGMTP